MVIPHGLYDVRQNDGHVNLGTSHDTSEFACDSIAAWWEGHGPGGLSPGQVDPAAVRRRRQQQRAASTCSRRTCRRLADRLGIEIRVAHYPPYCSKYNPIEHRLFPHVTRACQGVIFQSVEMVKQLMEKAKTTTGLRVTVDILDKVYETGRKYAEGFKENMKIVFDDHLPKWNYRAVPSRDKSGSYF